MNRGSGTSVDIANQQTLASMRPRFMNRGSKQRIDADSVIVGGFNEAPIHESGK